MSKYENPKLERKIPQFRPPRHGDLVEKKDTMLKISNTLDKLQDLHFAKEEKMYVLAELVWEYLSLSDRRQLLETMHKDHPGSISPDDVEEFSHPTSELSDEPWIYDIFVWEYAEPIAYYIDQQWSKLR